MNQVTTKILHHHNKRLLVFDVDQSNLQLVMTTADFFDANLTPMEKKDELAQIYSRWNLEKVYAGHQVHGCHIESVDGNLSGNSDFFTYEYPQTDGLITDRAALCLATKFADCTPVILFEPEKKILANLHSGWRGTQQKIASKAIERLVSDYGCQAKNLIAFVGPAIDAKSFEVRDDLVELFHQSHGDVSPYLSRISALQYQFDMRSLLIQDLFSEGILPSNLYYSDLSTYTESMLHSHRRDGVHAGRMMLFSWMR